MPENAMRPRNAERQCQADNQHKNTTAGQRNGIEALPVFKGFTYRSRNPLEHLKAPPAKHSITELANLHAGLATLRRGRRPCRSRHTDTTQRHGSGTARRPFPTTSPPGQKEKTPGRRSARGSAVGEKRYGEVSTVYHIRGLRRSRCSHKANPDPSASEPGSTSRSGRLCQGSSRPASRSGTRSLLPARCNPD